MFHAPHLCPESWEGPLQTRRFARGVLIGEQIVAVVSVVVPQKVWTKCSSL